MADPEGRSSVDLEDFKFISLLEYSADNRKVSRKKHLLNARQEQFFLPEGHCSCILWEKSPKRNMWGYCFLEELDTMSRPHGS